MMNIRCILCLALSGIAAFALAGCATSPAVTRGQEPLPEPFVRPANFGHQPKPHEVLHDSRHYETKSHHSRTSSPAPEFAGGEWHGGHAGYDASPCPPPDVQCPYCKGNPPGDQICQVCQGRHDHHGSLFNHQPQHHLTYSYHRPKNLVYPPPQVPGGAVNWPYYTLKGPSDFFRE